MYQASYACLITDTWHNEVESFINSQFLQSLTGRGITIAEIWWSGGKLLSKLDQMEFKQLCFYGSRFRLEVVESSLEILLRSWVQLPPCGPSFPTRELRYCFELILDYCRTNPLGFMDTIRRRQNDKILYSFPPLKIGMPPLGYSFYLTS
jgi:hypothetical protein